ncbi:hypothetical protein QFZ24_009581 [Streptomyces phaeochromogenes]|nr:hypothetical protein [Streptomyces phaeochromogenes]
MLRMSTEGCRSGCVTGPNWHESRCLLTPSGVSCPMPNLRTYGSDARHFWLLAGERLRGAKRCTAARCRLPCPTEVILTRLVPSARAPDRKCGVRLTLADPVRRGNRPRPHTHRPLRWPLLLDAPTASAVCFATNTTHSALPPSYCEGIGFSGHEGVGQRLDPRAQIGAHRGEVVFRKGVHGQTVACGRRADLLQASAPRSRISRWPFVHPDTRSDARTNAQLRGAARTPHRAPTRRRTGVSLRGCCS